ncbi:hypothetical protein JTE90_021051 [Oedothorax gibbosus]|uniref:Uncharacterized protein n=1 Tax=Oedothorax gibbosus TaxID=931172 RepID=A0AAV6VTD4_9ARAC|nr:hypothetical protein JTE90_021051 [Oedothorax gibbosus]
MACPDHKITKEKPKDSKKKEHPYNMSVTPSQRRSTTHRKYMIVADFYLCNPPFQHYYTMGQGRCVIYMLKSSYCGHGAWQKFTCSF